MPNHRYIHRGIENNLTRTCCSCYCLTWNNSMYLCKCIGVHWRKATGPLMRVIKQKNKYVTCLIGRAPQNYCYKKNKVILMETNFLHFIYAYIPTCICTYVNIFIHIPYVITCPSYKNTNGVHKLFGTQPLN